MITESASRHEQLQAGPTVAVVTTAPEQLTSPGLPAVRRARRGRMIALGILAAVVVAVVFFVAAGTWKHVGPGEERYVIGPVGVDCYAHTGIAGCFVGWEGGW